MTDLQKNLAEVVRLMYAYESGRGEGDDFDDANHSFIRTHHATIIDMAKRLEAAERDAARLKALEQAMGEAQLDWNDHGEPSPASIRLRADKIMRGGE